MGDTVIKIIIDADNRTGNEFKEVEKSGSKLGESMDKLAAGSLIAVAGFAALKAGLGVTLDMIKLGDESQKAETALSAFAGSADKGFLALTAMTNASGGALDKLSAMQQGSRLFSMGLVNNAKEAGELTNIIITLGSAMGRDAASSFEDFSLMLANTSIPRLDSFGISSSEVRTRMLELARTFPDLDRAARFTMATMEIGADKVDTLTAANYEAVTSIEKMETRITDAKTAMGEWFADTLNPMIDAHIEWTETMEGNSDALILSTDSLKEYNIAAILNNSNTVEASEKITVFTTKQYEARIATMKATEALENQTDEVVELAEEIEKPKHLVIDFDSEDSWSKIEKDILGIFTLIDFTMSAEAQKIRSDTDWLSEMLAAGEIDPALAQDYAAQLFTETQLALGETDDLVIATKLEEQFNVDAEEAIRLVEFLRDDAFPGLNEMELTGLKFAIDENLLAGMIAANEQIHGADGNLTEGLENLNTIRFPDAMSAINTGIGQPLGGAVSSAKDLKSELASIPTSMTIDVKINVDDSELKAALASVGTGTTP